MTMTGEKLTEKNLGLHDEVMEQLSSGNLRAAEALCLQSGYNDNEGTLSYVRALIARKNKDWNEALLNLEHALLCSPDNSDYLDEKGYALYQQGKLTDATQIYEIILTHHPQHLNALNNLAVIYTEQNRLIDAEELLHRSLAIDSHQVTTWLNLCSAVEAQVFREKDAVHYAEQAVKLASGDIRPYLYLCKALLRQGYPEKALETISQAAAIDPRNTDVHYRIGLCHMQLGNYQDAAQAFQITLAINGKHSKTLHALGELFFELNDLDAAEEACRQAIHVDNENANYKRLLARILFSQERYQDAEKIYNDGQKNIVNKLREAPFVRLFTPIQSIEQCAIASGWKTIETIPPKEWTVWPPNLLGHITQSKPEKITIPNAYISEIKDATIFPYREIILSNNGKTASYNLLASLRKGTSINTDENLPLVGDDALAITELPIAKKVIDTGIYMLTDHPKNYSHWITEVLTRFHAIDHIKIPETVPLLVNEDLFPQQIESLRTLSNNKRKIIIISNKFLHRIKTLFFPSSPVSYFQTKVQPGEFLKPSEATFQPVAINHIRNRLLSKLNNQKKIGQRLWISRKNQKKYRRFLNEDEIESIFARNGFETIYPEEMSFSEQVEKFSTADMIAGGTGAGMTNMIFSPPNSKILAFTVLHPHIPYNYFHNLATINHQELAYATGNLLKNFELRGYDFQSDFTIPTIVAKTALRDFFGL